jgi:hypothetical protein
MIALARVSGLEELAESTADDSTAIIQAFFRDGSIQNAAPVTIPLMVPAVVTYMTAINLRRQEAGNEGEDKLSVYERFFEAIEDIIWLHPSSSGFLLQRRTQLFVRSQK